MRIVKIVTICPALLELIAPSQQRAPRGRVAVRAGQMEAERIGEPVVEVEQHADLDRVLNALIAHAGGAEWLHIGRPHVRLGPGAHRAAEEFRPVKERLHYVRHTAPAHQGDEDELQALRQAMAVLHRAESHYSGSSPRSAASPRSSRPSAAPSAAATVTSKRASSELPERCSAAMSPSVTV